jgi:hypothetical protein
MRVVLADDTVLLREGIGRVLADRRVLAVLRWLER